MGAWVEAGCAEGVAIHETRGERAPVTGGPADVVTVALDTAAAGVWTVVPRGYDNLAANPTAVCLTKILIKLVVQSSKTYFS